MSKRKKSLKRLDRDERRAMVGTVLAIMGVMILSYMLVVTILWYVIML